MPKTEGWEVNIGVKFSTPLPAQENQTVVGKLLLKWGYHELAFYTLRHKTPSFKKE